MRFCSRSRTLYSVNGMFQRVSTFRAGALCILCSSESCCALMPEGPPFHFPRPVRAPLVPPHTRPLRDTSHRPHSVAHPHALPVFFSEVSLSASSFSISTPSYTDFHDVPQLAVMLAPPSCSFRIVLCHMRPLHPECSFLQGGLFPLLWKTPLPPLPRWLVLLHSCSSSTPSRMLS